MIWDGENLFFWKKALSAATLTSDVLNVGPGEASDNMTLHLSVANGSTGGTLSTVLETSATEDFASATTLGTYTTMPVSTPIPRGNKGFLRLKSTSTYTSGALTAGLVLEDNIRL